MISKKYYSDNLAIIDLNIDNPINEARIEMHAYTKPLKSDELESEALLENLSVVLNDAISEFEALKKSHQRYVVTRTNTEGDIEYDSADTGANDWTINRADADVYYSRRSASAVKWQNVEQHHEGYAIRTDDDYIDYDFDVETIPAGEEL